MIPKPIPYGKQTITQEDIEAVVEVLQSDFLTQGPKIAEFEEAFAKYIGAKYAVAVSNGTAALHLSVLSMNIAPCDKVITTPITFAATANCVRYASGDVVFADIDPETYLIDIKQVEKLLAASPKGTYKGIIPVDFAGKPVDLEALKKLADEYGCWIIEDACHAPGAYFSDSKGQRQNCGNGVFADLAIFSFHPVKHIATGEGGMITTNNEALYKKLLLLRTHGISKDPELLKENHGGWYYEMQELGFNYRLTDFQAALGTSQLKKADERLERRREIARRYDDAFNNKKSICFQAGWSIGHAYHLYIIKTENRKGLYDHLRTKGIYAQVHYIPVHLMPYYRQFGWKEGDLINAEHYYSQCLSLPMFPALSDQEQDYVIETVLSYLK
jgi:hypothetical protein